LDERKLDGSGGGEPKVQLLDERPVLVARRRE